VRGVKLFGILAISVLFITGCGNQKTLTCSMSEEDDGLSMNQELNVVYEEDKIANVRMSIDAKITDDQYQEYWDMFVSMMESQYEEKNADGIKVSTNNDDNYTFNITLDVDLEKASADDLATYDLEDLADETATYEELKEQLEESGYTCK